MAGGVHALGGNDNIDGMHLIMFDIDGTLTQTCAADSECFVQAVRELLGLAHVDSDWSLYRHVTDSGIAAEIIGGALARGPVG